MPKIANRSHQDLVEYVSDTLPKLPDDSISELVQVCGLTLKDAKTLVELDDGARLDYYDDVLECLGCSLPAMATSDKALGSNSAHQRKLTKVAANWYTVLMALTSTCQFD